MFTGLIEEVGSVLSLRAAGGATQLKIAAPGISQNVRQGDSVALNGCCLTVSAHRGEEITFDLLEETLSRTNLGTLRPDSAVNLERALVAGGRIAGHFVQGHVDCAVPVHVFEKIGVDHRLEMELPPEFAQYVIYKGSIAVNGISLTVAEVLPDSFAVWIIPQTLRETNLNAIGKGARLNLEFDLLAKYVERMAALHRPREEK
ncbi:MAG: riboflavin synthase [Chthoniobacterales bacterium]